MTDRVVRDGQVAVLISPGFGAGWSTWADPEYRPDVMFDPWIVDILLSDQYNKKEKNNRIMTHCNLKYPDQYLGGLGDLTVAWVPQGTWFRVVEYDGSESLEFKENDNWILA